MSDPFSLVLAAVLGALLLVAAWLVLRQWRSGALPQPLPEALEQRLDTAIGLRAQLSPALQALHLQQVQRFLTTKRFIGCGGLTMIDDMRIAIAGMACLLALRPGAGLFPAVRSVLVYPSAFLVPIDTPDELGLVSDQPEERIGESWTGDRVILAWDEVQAALTGDASNVVVHEFAHQLDDETPALAGVPALADVRGYQGWAEVMEREYQRLRQHRRPPVLDPYGAESPEEFFSVASEAFIQRGAELARHHAELYRLLAGYYGFETAPYFSTNARSIT